MVSIRRRLLSFLIIQLFFASIVFGQNRSFIGSDGDCLIFQGDTIFLKLNNQDAFNTFSIYYGKAGLTKKKCSNTRGKLLLKQNIVDIYASETAVNNSRILPRTQIRLIQYDGTPFEYTEVTMRDNNNILYHGWTNGDGILFFENEIVSNSRQIVINGLGVNLEIENNLSIGSENIIRCLIPYPFIKIRSVIKNVSWEPSGVVIKYNGRKHFLKKTDKSRFCGNSAEKTEDNQINAGTTFKRLLEAY